MRVDEEWKKYQEANPEANHGHQDHFKFHNKKMQEWFEEANSETKKKVEEFRQNSKGDLLEGDKDPNCIFQEWAIHLLFFTY